MSRRFLHVIAVVWTGVAPLGAAAELGGTFESEVRPILKAHCFHCHGEGEKLNGHVDLRLRRFLVETETEHGRVVVPGQPERSLMMKLVESGEMPKGEKKLSEKEARLIAAWIQAGAKTAGEEPLSLPKGFFLTDQERQFWAFQPIGRPAVPASSQTDRVRTPIDAFILEKLREQRLEFAPEADRSALIRRVYFDLLGLPPSPEAVHEFETDHSPDAYERLVDRVLESPRYGERWGRHWLDVAGYADSNGYAEADSVRPHAWRYRDYVIRSFNADKPWDQFIVEQLAGDELAGATQANAAIRATEARAQDWLAATGFLLAAPDGTGDPDVDQTSARNQTIAETLKVVSSSLLGMTVGCAQCHDHRYDPISQMDYYRLRAVFEPAFDWKNWRTPSQRFISLYTGEERARADEIEAEARKIDAAANAMRKEFLEQVFAKELTKLPEEIREAVKAARHTPRAQRSAEQVALLKKHPSADVQGALDLYDPEANKKVQAKQQEAQALRATKPSEPFLAAVTEAAGKVPETVLFARGDPQQPRQPVAPGEMEVLRPALAAWAPEGASGVGFGPTPEGLASSGRRLAYAKWLTSGRHPLVARVLVNRFWLNHFGRGLVQSPADFGQLGERPSHAALLDWLASEFMGNGWKLKPLHRLILTSAVYRQSSRHDAALRADPENRWYARMTLRRLEAEALRDAILTVSGRLNEEWLGAPLPIAQDDAGRVVVGQQKMDGRGDPTLVEPIGERAYRRSIYVQVRRSLPLTVLESFDAPIMTPNCELRTVSTVAPQALTLMNDSFVAAQAQRFAERLRAEHPRDVRRQVQRAWQLAYGIDPHEGEIERSLVYLADQAEQLRARVSTVAQGKADLAKPAADAATLALASLCQGLICANRFLYVE